jgi:hypothetical protein
MGIYNITVIAEKQKIPAFVFEYENETQKLDWIIKRIPEEPGKTIIVDQKRTFLEESLGPFIKRKFPDIKVNTVTAFSEESYEPSASLTLGSPSMATGVSIDQPVDLFIICFNNYISRSESYEQTMARLRNHNGMNQGAKIFILTEKKSLNMIYRFAGMHKKATDDQRAILDRINVIIDSHGQHSLSQNEVKLIEKTGSFMPVIRGSHHYDETYFKILCRDNAEHNFTRSVGTINFLRYFMLHPEILSGVQIVKLSQLPKITEEEQSIVQEINEQSRAELKAKVAQTQRCANFKQAQEVRKELKEGQYEGEERELKSIALAKFRAEFLGVEDLNRTMSGLYSQSTKRRPIAVVNTWLNLFKSGLADINEVLPVLYDTLRVGKEPLILLFDFSKKIWIPAHLFLSRKQSASELSSQIELILRSLTAAEFKEAFQGQGSDYLVARKNQILKLIGLKAEKRKPSSNNPDKVKYLSLDKQLSLENGVDIETLLIWSKSHNKGLGHMVCENMILQAKSLKEIDTAIKKDIFTFKEWYQDHLKNPQKNHPSSADLLKEKKRKSKGKIKPF